MNETLKDVLPSKLCRFLEEIKSAVPQPQYERLKQNLIGGEQSVPGKENPYISPNLDPLPQKWWRDSFGFFVALDLVPSGTYGPFYRLDGEYLWPEIGNPEDPSSEKQCFFGIGKVHDRDEAERLWAIRKDNQKKFVYKFSLRIPESTARGQIYLGSVAMGDGYQMNPNRITNALIQSEILRKEVLRAEICENGSVSEKWDVYLKENTSRDAR